MGGWGGPPGLFAQGSPPFPKPPAPLAERHTNPRKINLMIFLQVVPTRIYERKQLLRSTLSPMLQPPSWYIPPPLSHFLKGFPDERPQTLPLPVEEQLLLWREDSSL